MKTAVYLDPALQKQYDEWGYVHIKTLLTSDEVEELLVLFRNNYPQEKQSYMLWNTLCDIPHDRSSVLSNMILKIVKPKLNNYVKNYVCPAATFLVKNPDPNSTVALHRDFSVQDEPEVSHQNIWLPLVDTTPENGQLRLLRGSHKFFNYPLPHNTPWPYNEYQELLGEYCNAVWAKAGDLIIYNEKTVHGSGNNTTPYPRPVVHFGILHPEAKLLYYYLNDATKEVTVYEVNYPFYFENAWGNQDGRFPILKKFNYNPPAYRKEEIMNWLEQNVVRNDAVVA